MKPLAIDRRWLLKGGAGVLAGLIGSSALADVLTTDNDSVAAGDGLLASQMRLGELLIRYLARHRRADSAQGSNLGANVVVSPASLAAILSLVDLGGSGAMHAAIHRTLGFKRTARRKAEKDLESLRRSVSALIAQGSSNKGGKDGPLVLANLVASTVRSSPSNWRCSACPGPAQMCWSTTSPTAGSSTASTAG